MDAVAAVDDVRVAVDEARHGTHAARVDHLGVVGQLHSPEHLLARTDGLDVPVADGDGGIVLHAEVTVGIDRCEGGQVVDQEVGGLHVVSLRAACERPCADPVGIRAEF